MPPAPFVKATVYFPNKPDRGITVDFLVDSGADGTLLPKKHLRASGARFLETRIMRGITGQGVQVRIYLVSIAISGIVINGIRAAAVGDDDESILGRDILNQLIVTLNGLGETTEIRDI